MGVVMIEVKVAVEKPLEEKIGVETVALVEEIWLVMEAVVIELCELAEAMVAV